jgi:hypothetical protein
MLMFQSLKDLSRATQRTLGHCLPCRAGLVLQQRLGLLRRGLYIQRCLRAEWAMTISAVLPLPLDQRRRRLLQSLRHKLKFISRPANRLRVKSRLTRIAPYMVRQTLTVEGTCHLAVTGILLVCHVYLLA